MSAGPRPLLIATLPARTPEEARRQVPAAREAGADVAEIRFDRWGAAAQGRMGELFPTDLPLLATLRSQAEGGEGPDDPKVRAAWFARAVNVPFAYIDLEASRDAAPAAKGGADTTFIASTHLPPGSDLGRVRVLLREAVAPGAIRKVVTPASVGDVLTTLLPALASMQGRYIVHTTGPSGPLLRAWARRLGMAAAYAALPQRSSEGAGPVEPSQIPVDRLRAYLDEGDAAPLFAVVGRPVGHSRSPDLHHVWMHRRHHVGLYVPLEFETESELAAAVPALAGGGFRGLNVTHPFKSTALTLATSATPAAQRCRCANTLTLKEGSVLADNTDLPAMGRRLEELVRAGEWSGRGAVVVGAGGAARAALAALAERGAPAWVLARDRTQQREVASEYGATPADLGTGSDADLVIQATTVGRSGEALEVDLTPWLRPGTLLLDYVYAPTDRRVEQLAIRSGARYEDGRRILAYSAAESFRQWWGEAPTDPDLTAALEVIAR